MSNSVVMSGGLNDVKRASVLLSVLLASISQAFAGESTAAAVHLALQPSSTLAGLPVSLQVTFVNGTMTTLVIPRRAVLRVRAKDGTEFSARCGNSTVLVLEDWPERALAPNQSLTEQISTDGGVLTPPWFLDARLSVPGRYELQLYLSDALLSEMSFEQVRRAAVPSDSAVLTVSEPEGGDAQVWSRMIAFASGTWNPLKLFTPEGDRFVRTIVREFPDSTYAGWLAAAGTAQSPEERSAFLKSYLRAHPKDPLYLVRLLRAAQWDISLMDKYSGVDPKRSRMHGDAARIALEEIVNSQADGMIRTRAAERLDYLKDR